MTIAQGSEAFCRVCEKPYFNHAPACDCVDTPRAKRRSRNYKHQFENLEKFWQSKCAYCGVLTRKVGQAQAHAPLPRPKDERSIDHFIPLIMGGSNHKPNLVLCCRQCNGEKGEKHPLQYPGTKWAKAAARVAEWAELCAKTDSAGKPIVP